MQLTQLLLATGLFASSVFAAPLASDQWTIKDMKRVCNAADTSCTWTFGINNGATVTPAKYVVEGDAASRKNGGPSNFGSYTVTSGWSGQFGPNNGFTTLSVVNNDARKIIWPAYTDAQLKGGNVVKPDQSYSAVPLP
ncbi:uncharacterized protein N7515_006898 [Penicillium bovifimosum]|uniref:Small secreted protein n=1 Tax=Penicillium bovifimosum TaxID=126998 RepID=A0A9W9GVJ4_9EURO|nr:uncharacterized protein N7515_006898 [Penicillium bovifimosum]KAJ5130859.1 hypothetical protein N7515_006898 [Penicillium bovifimosum]